ncbi:MAG: ComF family protein [Anaerolineae bacterium]
MQVRGPLQAIATGFLDFVYPPRCVGCGRFGAWICDGCLAEVPPLRDRRPLTLPDGTAFPVWSVGAHLGVLRTAVHALKYEDERVLAGPLGALLAGVWRVESVDADCIVAVPLHRARLRERGYNQSQLLAEALGAAVGLPVMQGGVARIRETPVQVGSSARQRRANVAGAFAAGDQVSGSAVVVIDDVCTSGATIEACASAVTTAHGHVVAALTVTQAVLAGPGV